MTQTQLAIRVAIKAPLPGYFDYLPPLQLLREPAPGMRVRVPFGRTKTIGVIVDVDVESSIDASRLRRIKEIIDSEAIIDPVLIDLLRWAALYYRHAPGEVFAAALPKLLREGRAAELSEWVWRLTADGLSTNPDSISKRAPRQAEALLALRAQPDGMTKTSLAGALGPGCSATLRALLKKQWIEKIQRRLSLPEITNTRSQPDFSPNEDQLNAITAIRDQFHSYAPFLLFGVTGSGKTEVYLRVIEELIQQQLQTLVLVPEIGLTPQLVNRFEKRLGARLAVMHSGLSDTERFTAWAAARDGSASVVVGTRSAVFTPLKSPGLIIVDEEHDASFKQQEGFRYSARDLAVMRAKRHQIPVVLGSATPSLESLHNADHARYTKLTLPARTAGAAMPKMKLVDLRREHVEQGFSRSLITAVKHHLNNDGQVLLFLNRRGFAPAWYCVDCGWVAPCRRCDARMTLHQRAQRLRCHHCGAERAPEPSCDNCKAPLQPIGHGTEKIEQVAAQLFPDVPLLRIDRDSTRRRGVLSAMIDDIRLGQPRLLVGTQMLTKGHHFPAVTLVGILDADQGLYGTDPRSSERLAQLIVQVAGRSGRADRPGEVLIQTHCPEHPLLARLISEGYEAFADSALEERQASGWPPFSSLVLIRAEATTEAAPSEFLQAAVEQATNTEGVRLLGPAPAPMARRAGRFRAQLLLQGERSDLHRFLNLWLPQIEALPQTKNTRWSVDVDPVDLF